MRQPSVLAEARTRFVDGGHVRDVRVRVRDSAHGDPDDQLLLAVSLAALAGAAMGLVGSNPSLVAGWLR